MMKRIVCCVFAIASSACGADTFTFVFIEGGTEADGGIALEASIDGASQDGGVEDGGRVEAADDASIEASVDAKPDVNMCPYSGSSECGTVIGAYCSSYAACCAQFPGMGACASWGSQANACNSHWTSSGFDCSSGKYSVSICTNGTACKNDITSVSCSAIFQSANPASQNFSTCPAFWSQFP